MRRTVALGTALLLAFLPPTRVTEDRSSWRETAWSKHLADELGGEAEARTPDGSRVDILTDEIAWEVDWCTKWSQGVGQALFYGLATGRKSGLILLQKNPQAERRYYLRALSVCARYGVTLRVVVVPSDPSTPR